jgi:hypothetical protein
LWCLKTHFPVCKDFTRRSCPSHINSLHVQRTLSWTFVFTLTSSLILVSQKCPFLSCFCTKISYISQISHLFLASSETIIVIRHLLWLGRWSFYILKSIFIIFIGVSINVIIICWSLFMILTSFPHQADEVQKFCFNHSTYVRSFFP